MRNTFAKEMTRLAKENKKLVLLSGDIGNRMFDQFKFVYPQRFINCGIAEGNMMSMAAGLALTGLRPVIYTITPFTTSRCFEQIKIGAAYHNANVIIVGTGSGLSYAELGATHHSLEDIGILSTLPGLRILTPCDSIELSSQLEECLSLEGPSYIRIGKKGEPDLVSNSSQTVIGKANIINEGSDILLLGIGPILKEAIDAANIIEDKLGLTMSVVSLGSIEPFDQEFLEKMFCREFKCWITLEEHGFQGGLASRVNNWLSMKENKKFDIINLCSPNEFIHYLGKQDFVRNKIGLDSNAILKKVEKYV